eukprot:IDg5317t1
MSNKPEFATTPHGISGSSVRVAAVESAGGSHARSRAFTSNMHDPNGDKGAVVGPCKATLGPIIEKGLLELRVGVHFPPFNIAMRAVERAEMARDVVLLDRSIMSHGGCAVALGWRLMRRQTGPVSPAVKRARGGKGNADGALHVGPVVAPANARSSDTCKRRPRQCEASESDGSLASESVKVETEFLFENSELTAHESSSMAAVNARMSTTGVCQSCICGNCILQQMRFTPAAPVALRAARFRQSQSLLDARALRNGPRLPRHRTHAVADRHARTFRVRRHVPHLHWSQPHRGRAAACHHAGLRRRRAVGVLARGHYRPGIIPRSTAPPPPARRDRTLTLHDRTMLVKFCETCRIWRPPRASHCATCNNCVQRFDHHCPWLGNDIGVRNYRSYFTFVSSSAVASIAVIVAAVWHIVVKVDHKRGPGIPTAKALRLALGSGATSANLPLIALCLLAFAFTGGLTVFHIYLTCNNVTTAESFKKASRNAAHDHDDLRGCAAVSYLQCTQRPASAISQGYADGPYPDHELIARLIAEQIEEERIAQMSTHMARRSTDVDTEDGDAQLTVSGSNNVINGGDALDVVASSDIP